MHKILQLTVMYYINALPLLGGEKGSVPRCYDNILILFCGNKEKSV